MYGTGGGGPGAYTQALLDGGAGALRVNLGVWTFACGGGG